MSYRACIIRQPSQLEQSLATVRESLKTFDATPFAKGCLAVTGIGASYEAAVATASELQRRGRRAHALHAVDLMKPGDPADAIIALSAGGRSIEPVTALKTNASLPSVALTSESAVPLAETAKASIIFRSGEDATPSSTGYTASLLAAGLLADAITDPCDTDWDILSEQANQVILDSTKEIARLSDVFDKRRSVDCVGAGASLGTAGEAALLIREAARIPAGATDTLHYLHGPMEPNDDQTAVVLFGDGREVSLAQAMADIGCAVLLVTTCDIAATDRMGVVKLPAVKNEIARAILEILPAQLLAAELSDRAGLTDVKFRYRQTDTKIKAE